jgi:hypothetical protein
VHERAMERGVWACHGVAGYIIGPAMYHYQNYNSYILETRGIQTINTLEFFPEKVEMPTTSTADRLARATEDLVEILLQPHPSTQFLQQGTIVNETIKRLTEIFSRPKRNETATPRADEKNNNSSNQPPKGG